jgi:ribosome-associated heat shock protein Hsp15
MPAWKNPDVDRIRVDRWLWSVRAFKTRSQATKACRSGHVVVNRDPAKPSTQVQVGDVVIIGVGERDRVLEVVRVIENRVGASVAAECMIDRTPPPKDPDSMSPGLVRERSAGRPTKRDRRLIDRLRQR